MEDISKIKTEKECGSKGHFWDRGQCKPLTLDIVMKTDLETFCKVAKGTMKVVGERISLGEAGVRREISRLCGFEALHVDNDRGSTSWAPNIPKMTDASGNWYLKGLTETAFNCAKNNDEKVVGSYEEVKEMVLSELSKQELKEIKKGELNLEELIQNKIQSEMEFQCRDIWDAIHENGKECFRGDWSGDDHDFYDINETEWLFTNDQLSEVWKEEEEVDLDEKEELQTKQWTDVNTIMEKNPLCDRFNKLTGDVGSILSTQKPMSVAGISTSAIELDSLTDTRSFGDDEIIQTEKEVFPSIKHNGKLQVSEVGTNLKTNWKFDMEAKDDVHLRIRDSVAPNINFWGSSFSLELYNPKAHRLVMSGKQLTIRGKTK